MPSKLNIDLNPELLGTVPDTILARQLNVSCFWVKSQRKKRGIPKCNYSNYNVANRIKNGEDLDWNQQPLGKMPDRVLAEQLNVTIGKVSHERIKRKIAACNLRQYKYSKLIPEIGSIPDLELIAKYHISMDTLKLLKNQLEIGREKE